ncbi:LOW QUALITY PROTEIN: histamine H2 receptor-like [Xenia sp. Carnegie-2017]|uniref:LOW QUALITY PROTEIN: histamine H2 receptor-like n=1 Tax=Xenia sp. Carnegie-2017 TaxID=2897299 RepID=UPI001F045798|nr:LOW QUALITY PROTEIN: histamine H2 receptor-like [Xenia sp. Carnegie-2017]
MFELLCRTTGAPTALSLFTGTISILFMITNIPGNLLVILAVIIDPNKNLRNPFNLLIMNLAIADLIVGVVTNPLSIHVHFKEQNEEISDGEIKAIHMSYFISCTASVLSIVLLACDRYIALGYPIRYHVIMKRQTLFISVIFIWFLSISLPFIYFEVGYIRYAFIFANTSVVIAIIVTLFTYTRLLMKFSARATSSYTEDGSFDEQKHITEMFIVVMIAVICCYLPSTILIYAMNFCKSCSCNTIHAFRDLQFVFVIANSSVNFFCYGFRSKKFRSAFKVILRLKKSSADVDNTNFSMNATQGVTEVT